MSAQPVPGYAICSALFLAAAALYLLVINSWSRRLNRDPQAAERYRRRLFELPAALSFLLFVALAASWGLSYHRTGGFKLVDGPGGGLVVAQSRGQLLLADVPYPPDTSVGDFVSTLGDGGPESPMWYYVFADAEPPGNKENWFGYICVGGDPIRVSYSDPRISAIVLPYWPLLLLSATPPLLWLSDWWKRSVKKGGIQR